MYQCLKDAGREGDWQSFAAFPIVTWQGRQNLVHEPLPYEMFKDLKYKGQWAPIPASLCARAQPSPDLTPGAVLARQVHQHLAAGVKLAHTARLEGEFQPGHL